MPILLQSSSVGVVTTAGGGMRATTAVPAELDGPTRNHGTRTRGRVDPAMRPLPTRKAPLLRSARSYQ